MFFTVFWKLKKIWKCFSSKRSYDVASTLTQLETRSFDTNGNSVTVCWKLVTINCLSYILSNICLYGYTPGFTLTVTVKVSKGKGKLMHIWKSANIFVFIWKKYVEDSILKNPLLFEICAREIHEKFVYRHSQTIEYVKN